jgi:hypothetical protein
MSFLWWSLSAGVQAWGACGVMTAGCAKNPHPAALLRFTPGFRGNGRAGYGSVRMLDLWTSKAIIFGFAGIAPSAKY